MPHTIEYEESPFGVRITFSGEVTGAEAVAVNYEIVLHERIAEIKYQLWDFSAASHFNVEGKELAEIVKGDKKAYKVNPDILIAIVGDDDFFYHADTLYAIYADEVGLIQKRFYSVSDAYEWINSQGEAAE